MEALGSNEGVALVLLIAFDAQDNDSRFIHLVGVHCPLITCLNTKTSIQQIALYSPYA